MHESLEEHKVLNLICLGYQAPAAPHLTACPPPLTFLRAAAAGGTAGAADIAAAILRTALAPAHSNQQEQEEGSHNDEDHRQPVCRGEAKQGLNQTYRGMFPVLIP